MEHLWPLGASSPSEARVAAVVKAYISATGKIPADPLTAEDRRTISEWLYTEDENMPRNEFGQFRSLTRGPLIRFVPLVHRDLSSKLAYLQQRGCDVGDPLDLVPLSVAFEVNIRPFSAQALDSGRLSAKPGVEVLWPAA